MADTEPPSDKQPEVPAKNTKDDQAKNKKAKPIYVFSVAPGGSPSVTELQDNEEGHATLANIVRVEQVLAAVIGDKLQFSVESVVTLTGPGRKNLVDRQYLEPERYRA